MTAKQYSYSALGQPTMLLYGNQQAIQINKPTYSEEGIQFLQVGIDEWMEASRELKDASSLKLYFYLCSNMNGLQKALSPADICNKTGMARSSYQEAKKKLIEKGYLSEYKPTGKMNYTLMMFYTNPRLNPYFVKEEGE